MAPQRIGGGLLVALAVVAALILASVIAYLASGPRASVAKPGVPRDALYGIALDAEAAARGDEAGMADLQKHLAQLKEASSRDSGAAYLQDPRFSRTVNNGAAVLQGRAALGEANSAAREIREILPKLVTQLAAVTTGLSGGALDNANRALERFELRAQRLQADVATVLTGAANGPPPQRLTDSTDYLGQVIQSVMGTAPSVGLPRLTGAEGERRLKALDSLYTDLGGSVRRLVAAAPSLPPAQAAAHAMQTDARALAAESVAAANSAAEVGPNKTPIVFAALGLLGVLVCLFYAARLRQTVSQQRLAVETQRKENDRNQQAILRLLDELSSLADGDLTVQATVTEDITGAIADSINYAVDALRGLVTTINQSAIQLDSATRQTQALSGHLAKASGAQSKQIASATESAGGMAASAEEVSGNAERASDVARHSVEVAHKGGDAVRRTIDGMNTIRETIQETSKRIKRLGESSQEIGNIVELINDIAEQTNILALNASIQASMAGDAGRGFAVVADEVQRLAERAANATKQIEVLVRTIQTDTNEAVVSMERSTTDVVGGALLAENAGAALEEIEQVSNQIASLVQNISASSRQQTGAAQNIARNMQILKEISAQTAESTHATSTAIAKLAELSAGLRKAASGFRLPGSSAEPVGASGPFKRLEDAKSTTGVRPMSALGGT